MDALLTINAGSQLADTVAPAKAPQKHEQQFGKVLNKKRQEHHRSEKPVAEKRSEPGQPSEPKEVVSRQPSADPQPQSVEPVEIETEAGVTVEAEEVVLGAGDVEEAEHVFDPTAVKVDAAAMDVAEDGVEPTLTDVAEIPECAVADADEEADKIPEDGVAELSLQSVETAVVTPAVAEGTAVAAPERQQQVGISPSPADVKPVQQQMAEAAVAVPNDDREIFSMSQVVASHVSDDVTTDEIVADEDIDPRFAGLLKPRNEKPVTQSQSPIKDVAQLHGSQKQEFPQAEELATALEEGLGQKPTVESTRLSGVAAKQVLDQLVQPAHHNLQSQGQVHPQGFDAVKGMPQTPTVQLSNGYQIPESQIFDQVVTQISGSVNGESGRMVLRLQPAELGSLKLDLKIEGDRVQAHLHAQTHQVQEVLERHLPQLRSALAEQGLKIDQFQVNVDQRQAEGQFDGQAQYQHQGSERQSDWNQQDHVNEEQMIPLAHLMQNGGGGISLHV